jgi:acetone carboxylase gamma subunit
MKCVCGYEDEKFIEIAVRCGDNTSMGHYFKVFFPDDTWEKRRIYACPECGTLKVEVQK